ncbi:MAG: LptF/LptG family permease, partial [candidate division Zixibacteria bacterium]|nr:LptF/LptG family permease [candidate division Zixibacteria bacterium]
PDANKKRLEIKNFTIEKKSKRTYNRVRNIHRQISKGHFYRISSFNVDRAQGTDIGIYESEGNRIKKITVASRIVYADHRWLALDAVVRSFDTLNGESYEEYDTLVCNCIREKPEAFSKRIGKPEDMSYDELKTYVEFMKRAGGPYLREAIDLNMKIAYPLTSCIVVLICIPFAANPKRSGIAVSFAVGALISLLYFVLLRSAQSAGYNEKIPKELAVWGVNGLFFIVGLITMFKARK